MLDNPPLALNDDFRYVLDALEKEGRNMFVTGKAGTGKSTLLQLFRRTTRKKAAVLAPTGVSALTTFDTGMITSDAAIPDNGTLTRTFTVTGTSQPLEEVTLTLDEDLELWDELSIDAVGIALRKPNGEDAHFAKS